MTPSGTIFSGETYHARIVFSEIVHLVDGFTEDAVTLKVDGEVVGSIPADQMTMDDLYSVTFEMTVPMAAASKTMEVGLWRLAWRKRRRDLLMSSLW